MQADIVTIGDEILIGQIIDTNSCYLAQNLNSIGVSVRSIQSISDEKNQIIETLTRLHGVDLVIITGGLGPTNDDVTKLALASYFQDNLEVNTEVLKHIHHLFDNYIKRPISQLNRNQSLVLSKAEILFNQYGTAPGMWTVYQGTTYVCLPGVPFEMKSIVSTQLLPKIKQTFQLPYILHRTLYTYGVGESEIALRLVDFENKLPNHIKLAYLPQLGKVCLRLSSKGNIKQLLYDEVDKVFSELKLLLEDIVELNIVGRIVLKTRL